MHWLILYLFDIDRKDRHLILPLFVNIHVASLCQYSCCLSLTMIILIETSKCLILTMVILRDLVLPLFDNNANESDLVFTLLDNNE